MRPRGARDSLFGWGSNLRRFDRAADDAGRTDWPSPRDGRPGTRVQITFSARNADVTLATEVGYTSAALLQRAQALTKRLDLPQADFITVETRRTAIVDIELNDYLQRGRFRSGFDLDLAGLAAALKAADLPQPVVIGVEESGDTALVTPGGHQTLAHQAWFAAPNEVPVGARLVYEARITWRVIPALLLFVIMPVFLMGALLLRSFRRPLPADATPLPSPGEVQKKYDRQAPVWTMLAGLMVLPLVLVFVLSPKDPFAGLDLLLPFSPTYLIFGVAGLTVVGTAVTALRRRRTLRTNAGEAPSSSEDPGDDPPAWAKFGWMGVLMVGMLGMPLLILIPVYNPQAQLWMLYGLFGWMGLMVVGAVLVGWLGMRASRTELRDGQWFAMAADLAGQGKVRVRRVALIRSRIANAYASVGGTVGLTTSLVRQLEPDEVRAVIAHELGHLKLRHPQRTLAISLGVSAVTLGIWFGLQALVGKHPSMEVRMLVNTPMVFMFAAPILRMLLMGRGMREREEQADRLAVEWTGDPELVIRAMERIHHLNQSPGRLKPSDEALSTHPSLAHRIEAIRGLRLRGDTPAPRAGALNHFPHNDSGQASERQ